MQVNKFGIPLVESEEGEEKEYRVWVRSVPGMYAQYDGKVDVFATDELEAAEKALDKLKRGAFKDRNRSMWKIEKVEEL